MTSEPTIAEIESAVLALYGTPSSNQARADEYLRAFAGTACAWNLSVELLRSNNNSVQFFAANTLYQKVSQEWHSLGWEQKQSIRKQVVAIMPCLGQAAEHLVLPRLALTLAAMSTGHEVQSLLAESWQLLSGCSATIICDMLASVPEQVEKLSASADTKQGMMKNLSLHLPEVMSLLHKVSQPTTAIAKNAVTPTPTNSPGPGETLSPFANLPPGSPYPTHPASPYPISSPASPFAGNAPGSPYPGSPFHGGQPSPLGRSPPQMIPGLVHASGGSGGILPPSPQNPLVTTTPLGQTYVSPLLLKKIFQCLSQWAKTGLNLDDFYSTPLFNMCFEGFNLEECCEQCADTLIETIENSKLVAADSGRQLEDALRHAIMRVIGLRKLYTDACSEDESLKCLAIVRVARCLGQSFCAMIAGTGDYLGLIELLVESMSSPDIGVVETCIPFWKTLQEIPPQNRHPVLLDDLYIQILRTLMRQVMYPGEFTGWERSDIDYEDFENLRSHAKDAFIVCYRVLRSNLLRLLCEALQSSQGNWQEIEVVIFVMKSVATEALAGRKNVNLSNPEALQDQQEADRLLLSVFSNVNSENFPSHSAVRVQMVMMIGAYSKLLSKNLNLMEPTISYTLACFSNSQVITEAAKALNRILIDCRSGLTNPHTFESLVGACAPMFRSMPSDSQVLVTEGLARVVAFMPHERIGKALEQLASPFVAELQKLLGAPCPSQGDALIAVRKLVMTQVRNLTSAVRFIEAVPSRAGNHPAMALHTLMQPLLDTCLSFHGCDVEISGCVCDFWTASMAAVKIEMAPLLPGILTAMVVNFQKVPHACFLEAISAAVETFGAMDGTTDHFASVVEALWPAVEAAASRDLGMQVDVVNGFFLILRNISMFSCAVLLSEKVNSLGFPGARLAMACLKADSKDMAKNGLKYIEHLFNLTQRSDRPESKVYVGRFWNMFGEQLMSSLVFALTDSSNRVLLQSICSVMYEMLVVGTQEASQWIFKALSDPSFPVVHLGEESKHNIVNMLVEKLGDKKRFHGVIEDFISLCASGSLT